MSATTSLSSTDPAVRPLSLGWPPQANDSDADWALVGKGSFSYAGRFIVTADSRPARGQISHGPMEVASLPSFVGEVEVRNYTVDGQVLVWHVEVGGNLGVDLRADVYWRRIG